MGQFSWNYADRHNRESLRLYGQAYVPCPDGTVIFEGCYQCYGIFGGYDIYELVAEWNKEYISESMIDKPVKSESYPNMMEWYTLRCNRIRDFVDGKSNDYMEKTYGNDWKRNIGIDIACGDQHNKVLKFPIKICKEKPVCYKEIPSSTRDPYQGR